MAHPNLHAALGACIASALLLPWLYTRWHRPRLAQALGITMFATYGLALWAIVPDLGASLGLAASPAEFPLRNLFAAHAWLDNVRGGGLLIGELVIVGHFILHYAMLLLAIYRHEH